MKRSHGLLLLVACVLAIAVILALRTGRRAAVREQYDAGMALAHPTRTVLPPLLSSPATAVPSSDMSLSGRLVSRLDGSGVGTAELTFSGQGQAHSVISGPDGTFQFQPPEPGRYQLATVSADGFLPFAPAWGPRGSRWKTGAPPILSRSG